MAVVGGAVGDGRVDGRLRPTARPRCASSRPKGSACRSATPGEITAAGSQGGFQAEGGRLRRTRLPGRHGDAVSLPPDSRCSPPRPASHNGLDPAPHVTVLARTPPDRSDLDRALDQSRIDVRFGGQTPTHLHAEAALVDDHACQASGAKRDVHRRGLPTATGGGTVRLEASRSMRSRVPISRLEPTSERAALLSQHAVATAIRSWSPASRRLLGLRPLSKDYAFGWRDVRRARHGGRPACESSIFLQRTREPAWSRSLRGLRPGSGTRRWAELWAKRVEDRLSGGFWGGCFLCAVGYALGWLNGTFPNPYRSVPMPRSRGKGGVAMWRDWMVCR